MFMQVVSNIVLSTLCCLSDKITESVVQKGPHVFMVKIYSYVSLLFGGKTAMPQVH